MNKFFLFDSFAASALFEPADALSSNKKTLMIFRFFRGIGSFGAAEPLDTTTKNFDVNCSSR